MWSTFIFSWCKREPGCVALQKYYIPFPSLKRLSFPERNLFVTQEMEYFPILLFSQRQITSPTCWDFPVVWTEFPVWPCLFLEDVDSQTWETPVKAVYFCYYLLCRCSPEIHTAYLSQSPSLTPALMLLSVTTPLSPDGHLSERASLTCPFSKQGGKLLAYSTQLSASCCFHLLVLTRATLDDDWQMTVNSSLVPGSPSSCAQTFYAE